MKMKKIVLLFSMIAVFFSLTACSSGQEDVTFEYTNTDIVSDTVYQAYNMQNVKTVVKSRDIVPKKMAARSCMILTDCRIQKMKPQKMILLHSSAC